MVRFLILVSCTVWWTATSGMTVQRGNINPFKEISLRTQLGIFTWPGDTIRSEHQPRLLLQYEDPKEIVEIRLLRDSLQSIHLLEIQPSKDFTLIDAPILVDHHYRLKIQFENLSKSRNISLIFTIQFTENDQITVLEVPLFPVAKTELTLKPIMNPLFIGEEKIFTLESNLPHNVRISTQWQRQRAYSYKLSRQQDELQLHLIPHRQGIHRLSLELSTYHPRRGDQNKLIYHLPALAIQFEAKPGKLHFLNFNRRELSYDRSASRPNIEVELEYDDRLTLEKTYRIEDQQSPGGVLIAEIYTRSILGNGRVLCWFRPYEYHRRSEGYLYLKDGDVAQFISNLDIIPAPEINSVSLLNSEGNWTNNLSVYPGERLEIKLDGQSLHIADIKFNGLVNLTLDSLVRKENELIFRGQVPLDIRKKRIEILLGQNSSGYSLNVREYQMARPFDYIYIQFGNQNIALSQADNLLFYDQTIKDVVIDFDTEQIDQMRLYGKQYLTIEIRVTDEKSKLIDTRSIDKVVVCPGASSPRFAYYRAKDCQSEYISINQLLRKKTFDLESWSTIEITIRNDPRHYPSGGYSKKIEIISRRYTTFDIDVSFPAGLIVKKAGEAGFGNLSSISMAMIAQFSFFQPDRIAHFKPYKVGVGFLALNAFNFNENNTNRDIGLVGLASFYPLRSHGSNRLSFPLYLGGGYFLSDEKWFFLLGPGIRIRL